MDNQNTTPNPEEQENNKPTPPLGGTQPPSSFDDEMMKTSIGTPTPAHNPAMPPSSSPFDDASMRTMLDAAPEDSSQSTSPSQAASTQPVPSEQPPADTSFDPHATTFDLQVDEPDPNFDPYATQYVSDDEKKAAFQGAEITPPAQPKQPSSQPQQKSQGASSGQPTPASGPKIPQLNIGNISMPQTSMVKDLGLLPLSAIYAVLIILPALGLAWFMRFVGILLLYGEISIIRTILGILGAGLAGGLFFALKYLPPLGGLQKRFDDLDLARAPISEPIQESRTQLNFWFFVFAGVLLSAAVVGAALSTEQLPIISYDGSDAFVEAQESSVDELTSDKFSDIIPVRGVFEQEDSDNEIRFTNLLTGISLLFGLIGAGILVGVSAFSLQPDTIEPSAERNFEPLQIILPLASGIALIMLAWSLKLINHQPSDFIYFFLLAVLGMYGFAAFNLRFLPARFFKWVSQVRVALYAGVLSLVLMSIVVLFLASSNARDGIDFSDGSEFSFTWRFAYSPAYFSFLLGDKDILIILPASIALVFAGLLGGFLTLQAFGYELVEDRAKGKNVLGLTFTLLLLLTAPTVLIVVLLRIISPSNTLDGLLLWGLPFALFVGIVLLIRTRPKVVDSILKPIHNAAGQLPNSLLFMSDPLKKVTKTSGEEVKALVTWPLGLTLAVVYSLIAAPFAFSFWFYALLLVGILFLTSEHQTPIRQPRIPSPTAGQSQTPNPVQPNVPTDQAQPSIPATPSAPPNADPFATPPSSQAQPSTPTAPDSPPAKVDPFASPSGQQPSQSPPPPAWPPQKPSSDKSQE